MTLHLTAFQHLSAVSSPGRALQYSADAHRQVKGRVRWGPHCPRPILHSAPMESQPSGLTVSHMHAKLSEWIADHA